MPSFWRHDVVLVHYPFSDLSGSKVRPAVIVSAEHPSSDLIIIALTSRTGRLLPGELLLKEWQAAGLNVPTAAKRGVYTGNGSLISRVIGSLAVEDRTNLDSFLRLWLDL